MDRQLTRLIHIYADCYEQLAISAVCVLRDTDSAYDALQNVMIQLLEKEGELPPLQNPTGFLFSCVRNEALNLLRRQRPLCPADPLILSVTRAAAADEKMERMETEEYVREKLHRYPAVMQDMFLDYSLEGCSPRELASLYALSPNVVSQRLRRMRMVFLRKYS